MGFLLEPYWDVAKAAWQQRGASGFFTWFGDYAEAPGFGARELVLGLFALSASSFVWLQRSAVKRFFRAMHTGVTLVTLSTLAVTVGVLIPQIDGFEDPEQRVDMAREYEDFKEFQEHGYQKLPRQLEDGHEQYQAFRWAEGYFLYHMLHLYGIGMPDAGLSPQMSAGLERYGRKYGLEEEKNRRKQMVAAFTGRKKIDEIGAIIADNEETFWRFFQVATTLQLNRTYKSNWFASLLMLLGVSIFFNTFKGSWRNWFTIQKLGYFVVHMGMMILLLGGLVSKLFTDRGILELYLGGEPKNTYFQHFNPRKQARMPFYVRLDEFARQDWKALEVHFPEEEFSSQPPRYTLWEGRELELDFVDDGAGGLRPDLRVTVEELYDRVEVGLPTASESADPELEGGSLPLAELLIQDEHLLPGHVHDERPEHDHDRRQYLLPLSGAYQTYRDEVYRDPAGKFRLASAYGGEPMERFPAAGGRLGLLEATVVGEGDGAPLVSPIELGTSVELPGGYRVEIVDASADFGRETGDGDGSFHPLPLAEQPYRFAALWADIYAPDEPKERRLILEAIDDVEYGRQDAFYHPEVVLNFRWDDWGAPGPPRFLLHWGGEDGPGLWSEDGTKRTVTLEEPLALPGQTPVRPLQLLHHATFEKNLSFLESQPRADGWDQDFYARTPRGVRLRVTRHPDTPEEWTETVEMATTDYSQSNLWFAPDNHFALRFLENAEMLPYEWRSVLTVLETDNAGRLYEVPLGSEKEREIRVNDYFYYKGFRFFQTNARPDAPDYSGIGVVYDPGIPFVLVGMYTVIAGTSIAFLLRPIVKGRRRRDGAQPREVTA